MTMKSPGRIGTFAAKHWRRTALSCWMTPLCKRTIDRLVSRPPGTLARQVWQTKLIPRNSWKFSPPAIIGSSNESDKKFHACLYHSRVSCELNDRRLAGAGKRNFSGLVGAWRRAHRRIVQLVKKGTAS